MPIVLQAVTTTGESSLLSIVQKFCARTNVPVPSSVVNSTDTQVKQILGILEEEGNDLRGRGDWQEITYEATTTTLAQEDQGGINTIASNGFSYIKNGTIWDRTLQLPVFVIDGQDWQAVKAVQVTGPRYQARIRGGRLLSNPAPTAGNTWAFEYVSKNWIVSSDAATYKQYFTADTDALLLPVTILLQGLRWRWKKEKGLEYAEDFRTYETMVKDALGRDGMKRNLNMSNYSRDAAPGIFVPAGSWAVP